VRSDLPDLLIDPGPAEAGRGFPELWRDQDDDGHEGDRSDEQARDGVVGSLGVTHGTTPPGRNGGIAATPVATAPVCTVCPYTLCYAEASTNDKMCPEVMGRRR